MTIRKLLSPAENHVQGYTTDSPRIGSTDQRRIYGKRLPGSKDGKRLPGNKAGFTYIKLVGLFSAAALSAILPGVVSIPLVFGAWLFTLFSPRMKLQPTPTITDTESIKIEHANQFKIVVKILPPALIAVRLFAMWGIIA